MVFSKEGTKTNLMEYVSFVAETMVAGGQVDTVYMDFAKAFDKVDHGTLIVKLRSFGLSNKIVHWFTTYLRQRTQFVVIGVTQSTCTHFRCSSRINILIACYSADRCALCKK